MTVTLIDGFVAKRKIRIIICSFPVVMIAVMNIIDYDTHFLFELNENGLVEGNFFWIFIAFMILYYASSIIIAFVKSFDKKLYVRRRIFKVIYCYSLILLCCLLIQYFMNPILPVNCFGSTFLIFLIHLNFLDAKVTEDPLTGLSNRNVFERKLGMMINEMKIYDEKNVCIMLLDIEGFRKINDTYGRVEGDKTLVLCANAIQRACGDNAIAGRFSSDNFAVAFIFSNDFEIKEMKRKIKAEIDGINRTDELPFYLSLFTGYSNAKADGNLIPCMIKNAMKNLKEAKIKEKDAYLFTL